MHVSALYACRGPAETADDTGSPATGVTHGCELPCGCQESNLHPLQDGKFQAKI